MTRIKKDPVFPYNDNELEQFFENPNMGSTIKNVQALLKSVQMEYGYAIECKDFKQFKEHFKEAFDPYFPEINEETQRKALRRPEGYRFIKAFFFAIDDDSAFKWIVEKARTWLEEGKSMRASGENYVIEGCIEHEINERRNMARFDDEIKRQFSGYSSDILSYVKRFAILSLINKGYTPEEYPMLCHGVVDEDTGIKKAGYLQINRCECSRFFPELMKYEKGSGCVMQLEPKE